MGPRSFRVDPDVQAALKAARRWTKFRQFPPLYQRVRAYNVAFYKGRDPETYEKALANLIARTKRGVRRVERLRPVAGLLSSPLFRLGVLTSVAAFKHLLLPKSKNLISNAKNVTLSFSVSQWQSKKRAILKPSWGCTLPTG